MQPLRLRATKSPTLQVASTAITSAQSAREFLNRAQNGHEAAHQACTKLAAFEDPDEPNPDLARARNEWAIATVRLHIAHAIAYSFGVKEDLTSLPDEEYELPPMSINSATRDAVTILLAMIRDQDAEIQLRFNSTQGPSAALPVSVGALQAGRVALNVIGRQLDTALR